MEGRDLTLTDRLVTLHRVVVERSVGWWGKRAWARWMDPEPGRVVSWAVSRAPWLIWLGGALGFGAAGVMFLVANPATLSTGADQAYGPDAPLQPWNLFFGVACLLCAAALLVLIPYLLVLRGRSARRAAQSAGAVGSEIDGDRSA